MNDKLYLYIDDSGKISDSEDVCCFAGVLFKSEKEKSEFSNKYKSILKEISCKYCPQTVGSCDHKCPEIKGSIIKVKDRRRLINLSHNFFTFAVVINNNRIFPYIKENKASKGRYQDYAIKRIVKLVIEELIKRSDIDKDSNILININIDEMSTKSNGYYGLESGIREELYHGVINYNYQKRFPPILFGEPNLHIHYLDSSRQVGVQMADVLANTLIRELKKTPEITELDLKNKLQINVILSLP